MCKNVLNHDKHTVFMKYIYNKVLSFFYEGFLKNMCDSHYYEGMRVIEETKHKTCHVMFSMRRVKKGGGGQQPQANRSEPLSLNNSITNWKNGDPAVSISSFLLSRETSGICHGWLALVGWIVYWLLFYTSFI